jgi:hypothetical protein
VRYGKTNENGVYKKLVIFELIKIGAIIQTNTFENSKTNRIFVKYKIEHAKRPKQLQKIVRKARTFRK